METKSRLVVARGWEEEKWGVMGKKVMKCSETMNEVKPHKKYFKRLKL